MLEGEDILSFPGMTPGTSKGGSSSGGMRPASAKAAGDTWSRSNTKKKTSSKAPAEKADTWALGIPVTLLGKFNNTKGSAMVARRKGFTKGLCCPSVSYKNDKPIYP